MKHKVNLKNVLCKIYGKCFEKDVTYVNILCKFKILSFYLDPTSFENQVSSEFSTNPKSHFDFELHFEDLHKL